MANFSLYSANHNTNPSNALTLNHRQPSTMPGGTSVTVRLRVTVPTYTELPDRVRLVVKERGVLFFPYCRKIASVQFDSWTRLPNNAWQGSLVQQVPMNVPKLLKKAQKKLLSLQLYCLHRRTVQHKAVGSLERLLHQGRYEELVLDLHYPGCPLHVQATTAQAADTYTRSSSYSHEGAEEPQAALDVAVDYYVDKAAALNIDENHDQNINETPVLNVSEAPAINVDEAPALSVNEAPVLTVNEAPALNVDVGSGVDEALNHHINVGSGGDEPVDHHVDVGNGDDEALDHHVNVGNGDDEPVDHHVDEGHVPLQLVGIGASFLATMGGLLYAGVTAVAGQAQHMETEDWVTSVALTAVFLGLFFMFRRRGLQTNTGE